MNLTVSENVTPGSLEGRPPKARRAVSGKFGHSPLANFTNRKGITAM
jgi:hypothetical protein